MLLKQRVLEGIAAGRITLAFRQWKRPTVKPGGSLRTPIGVLAIEAVDIVEEEDISEQEAHLVLVNGHFVNCGEDRNSRQLSEGDTVSIWPPVAGG